MEQREVERRFVYHPPTEETRALHEEVRGMVIDYVSRLLVTMGDDAAIAAPSSREISLFLTAMEEASFWAHAHIARNRQ